MDQSYSGTSTKISMYIANIYTANTRSYNVDTRYTSNNTYSGQVQENKNSESPAPEEQIKQEVVTKGEYEEYMEAEQQREKEKQKELQFQQLKEPEPESKEQQYDEEYEYYYENEDENQDEEETRPRQIRALCV